MANETNKLVTGYQVAVDARFGAGVQAVAAAIVERARAYGMHALALTDHGAMYAAVEFCRVAEQHGIKPIIGCEVYVAPRGRQQRDPKLDTSPYHLVLLARDEEGYQNLIQLCTR
ncbi:MAG: PHP domain-containing protein, partial [Anaerolineae bacterium]|nr:PHP domain-containing protein [Anaerolineae bacterium]